MADLEKMASGSPEFKKMCDKLGVAPGIAVSAILGLVLVLGIIIKGYDILIAALTVVYPMWCSVLAIEDNSSSTTNNWLTYWTIYSLFNVLELFIGFIFDFIPYFWVIRLGFFLYLMNPTLKGANTIYETFLKSLLVEHKEEIEKFFESVRQQGDSMGAEAMANAAGKVGQAK